MNQTREYFHVREDAEITVECNPGTVDKEKLLLYKMSGVNRISLGLQSADNAELRVLGRIHTFEDFLESYDAARKAGFENINVDLMSGLLGQTLESYEKTLKQVVRLKPEHISAYSLIIEKNTPFMSCTEKMIIFVQKASSRNIFPVKRKNGGCMRGPRNFWRKTGCNVMRYPTMQSRDMNADTTSVTGVGKTIWA